MCEIDDPSKTFGYPAEVWQTAKDKLRTFLWQTAKGQTWVSYGDAAVEIRDIIPFHPHDSLFHHMLGQISVEEDAAGRGLLSALVVHKEGDKQPGQGFYDLAARLGRNVDDPTLCWVDEMKRLFEEASVVKA
jgi:hypothetical protein